MIENTEIKALFHLIDDPDEEVFVSVSDRIISLGKGIIPNLESLWENTPDENVQERIETLIHKLHFRDLTDEFINWNNGSGELLQGALLTSQYHYPEIQPAQALAELEKIRRNIWLELNNYLTSLEQINIVSSILYNYYKLKGVETAYLQPEEFLITKSLEAKKGNAISNGIIYLVLSELLDIPVKAVNIPGQFILAYFDPRFEYMQAMAHAAERILFYIDPLNGQVYTHKDVEGYLKRINETAAPAFFKPQSNRQIIHQLLKELSKCFDNDRNRYKMEELLFLAKFIHE